MSVQKILRLHSPNSKNQNGIKRNLRFTSKAKENGLEINEKRLNTWKHEKI